MSSWTEVLKTYFNFFPTEREKYYLFINDPLVEKFDLHSWKSWFTRSFKRDKSELVIYDETSDSLRTKGLYLTRDKDDNFSKLEDFKPLALTPNGDRRALFLDRDGVINVDKGYVSSTKDLVFVDGIEKLIKFCNEMKILVIVLTNQSGVGRGYYAEEDVYHLHQYMDEALNKKGAKIDAWYFSPYHPESKIPKYKKVSLTRKPGPGMILNAAYKYNIDLERSLMIGDKTSDILSHVDVYTILLKGNYETGTHKPVVENHKESFEYLNDFFNSPLSVEKVN